MTAACKLYLTYRTEYLVLHELCVGVRDRRTSTWQPLHAAACSELLGPLRIKDDRLVPGTRPKPGERMCFEVPSRRLWTGPVVAIEDPSDAMMERAERRWRELFQPSDPSHTKIVLTGT